MDRQGMQTQGISHEQLERVERFIDDAYIATGKLPGTLVQMWRRDELTLNSVLGLANREHQVLLAGNSIFHIYPTTKPITSVAFTTLVEEYKVTLGGPVSKFIPVWTNLGIHAGDFMEGFQSHPVKRPMRTVNLLCHTSGLTYSFHQNMNVDVAYRRLKLGGIATDGTLDEMVEKLAGVPLEFSPGEAWSYSISTDVLGYLVGRISGMLLETFLKERVFDPLGMVDAAFHMPKEKTSRFCACYAVDALGSKAVSERGLVLQGDPHTNPYLRSPSFISGGGGLISTATDYLRFSRILPQSDKLDDARLLAPKILVLVTVSHLPDGRDMFSLSSPPMFSEAAYDGVGFGLGFATTISQAATLIPDSAGDFLWGGAAGTFFWVGPQKDLIDLFLTQVLPSSAYPVRRRLHAPAYSTITNVDDVVR